MNNQTSEVTQDSLEGEVNARLTDDSGLKDKLGPSYDAFVAACHILQSGGEFSKALSVLHERKMILMRMANGGSRKIEREFAAASRVLLRVRDDLMRRMEQK